MLVARREILLGIRVATGGLRFTFGKFAGLGDFCTIFGDELREALGRLTGALRKLPGIKFSSKS
jgi:hypothetical protein